MSSDGSDPTLISIDWGTSSFRAFLMGRDGDILDRVSSCEGIMHLVRLDGENGVLLVLVAGMTTEHGNAPYVSASLLS